MNVICLLTLLVFCIKSGSQENLFLNKNYYDILDVKKTATTEEIKKAYKKLARKLHPDRAGNSEDAHNNYMKLTKAYEVLIDHDLREKYDTDGKLELEDMPNNGQNNQMFDGIYLKDADYITTLKSGIFDYSVRKSGEPWLVKFYSPYCSHCVDFGDTYRQLGRNYKNIINIGAFNCMSDDQLCHEERVNFYPTIKIYPSGDIYSGDNSIQSIDDFIMQYTHSNYVILSKDAESKLKKDRDSVIVVSYAKLDFDDTNRVKLLALALESLNVKVYLRKCDASEDVICGKNDENRDLNVLFIPKGMYQDVSKHERFYTLDTSSLVKYITNIISKIEMMEEDFAFSMNKEIKKDNTKDYLLLLVNEKIFKKNNVQYALLHRSLSGDIPFFFLNCEKTLFCKKVYLDKPSTLVYLNSDGVQVHHGNLIAGEMKKFYMSAKYSNAVNLHPLHKDWGQLVDQKLQHGVLYLYNSLCQPCIKKIWEFRRLGSIFSDEKSKHYLVDCSHYRDQCVFMGASYGFPYVKFYNGTSQEMTNDFETAEDMLQFIHETSIVFVQPLTPKDIDTLVLKRKQDEIWLVDYDIPRCSLCAEFVPILRKLAKSFNMVKFGRINCEMYFKECRKWNIARYPLIRVFPANYTKSTDYKEYNQWLEYSQVQLFIRDFLPSAVIKLSSDNYGKLVKADTNAYWVIDLYASWCGPCHNFMPTFEEVAQKLSSDKIKFGKVECDADMAICNELQAQYYPYVVLVSPYNKHNVQHIDSRIWDANMIAGNIKFFATFESFEL